MLSNTTTRKKLVAFENGATAMLAILPHQNRRHNIKIEVYNPSPAYFEHMKKIKQQEAKLKARPPVVVPINTEPYHGYFARRLFKALADKYTPELQEEAVHE
jgi:hypothetical protein